MAAGLFSVLIPMAEIVNQPSVKTQGNSGSVQRVPVDIMKERADSPRQTEEDRKAASRENKRKEREFANDNKPDWRPPPKFQRQLVVPIPAPASPSSVPVAPSSQLKRTASKAPNLSTSSRVAGHHYTWDQISHADLRSGHGVSDAIASVLSEVKEKYFCRSDTGTHHPSDSEDQPGHRRYIRKRPTWTSPVKRHYRSAAASDEQRPEEQHRENEGVILPSLVDSQKKDKKGQVINSYKPTIFTPMLQRHAQKVSLSRDEVLLIEDRPTTDRKEPFQDVNEMVESPPQLAAPDPDIDSLPQVKHTPSKPKKITSLSETTTAAQQHLELVLHKRDLIPSLEQQGEMAKRGAALHTPEHDPLALTPRLMYVHRERLRARRITSSQAASRPPALDEVGTRAALLGVDDKSGMLAYSYPVRLPLPGGAGAEIKRRQRATLDPGVAAAIDEALFRKREMMRRQASND